jgi:hypothetical protein
MGMCDRKVGACSCFDGFVGEACQRMGCPTATGLDCSGHGECMSIKRMARSTKGAVPLSAATYYSSETEVARFNAADTAVVSLTEDTIVVDRNFYNRVERGTAAIYHKGTAVIAGLTDGTTYYIIPTGTTTSTTGTIRLAASEADAMVGIDKKFTDGATQSGFGSATALHTLTTTQRSRESYTWDEEKIFGCVCDSTWTVGLGSGQTQMPEYYGPDCSLMRCPSNDDPLTFSQPIAATIHSQGSNYNTNGGIDFDASKVLADDTDAHGHIWLGPDSATSYFVLTLGAAYLTNRGAVSPPYRITSFKLRNTKNDVGTENFAVPKNDRTTTGYTVQLSTDASTWTTVVTGTLNPYDISLQEIVPTVDMEANYVKFSITTYAGTGGGLGYFQAFLNDDERRCDYVVAEGGFGTGAAFNQCRVECSNRGICDPVKGDCICYPGFTGEDCSTVNAFAGGS